MGYPKNLPGILLAAFLAVPGFLFPSTSLKSRARLAYDRAVEMRQVVAAKPEASRSKDDYQRVINAFQSVYRLDPGNANTPLALKAVIEVYEEMGRVFEEKRYYRSAIEACDFLIREYPKGTPARDALFLKGAIYEDGLDERGSAEQVLRHYLEKYPRSDRAAEARNRLKEMAKARPEETSESRASEGISDSTAPSQTARNSSPAANVSARPPDEQSASGGLAQVTSIRRWVGPNYTRIVIAVDNEVRFDAIRLVNPDRLVFDLTGTRPGPSLLGKVFPVEDGFLKQVRIALYRPTVTRVVLDVEKIQDYTVFSLPNPFRLVIDVHGPEKPAEKTEVAKGPPSAPAGPGTPSETKSAASARNDAPDSAPPPAVTRPAPEIEAAANPPTPGARTLTRALGLKIGRIVIDPGHGGHDTGTTGPTGLMEKDVVLDVAKRLAKLMEDRTGSEVVLTRTDDTFVPLEERTAIANQKRADLFISIHANASRDRSARGVETYYLNFTSNAEALEVAARENSTSQESVYQLQDLIKKIALTEKVEESHELARLVQHEVHGRLARASSSVKDRGVKKAPFVVLIGANMPSVLAEISFLTNPSDEKLLRKGDYRKRIAEALYQGVAHYVRNVGGVKVARQSGASADPSCDPSPARAAPEDSASDPRNF